MTRFRNCAAIGLASTLMAACGTSGGNNGNGQVAGYPASYSPQHANIQERVGARYDEQTIIQAQRALGDKGFDVGAIDGIWGPSSQSALRDFQQANGMTADGRLGAEVLAALDGATSSRTAGARQSPERRTLAHATDGASQTAAEREGGMRGGNGKSAAARSDSVDNHQQANNQQGVATRYDQQTIRQAQRALGQKGFDVGAIDGIWGPSSRTALENFQKVEGMNADGRLRPEVLAALDVDRAGTRAGERNAQPSGMRSAEQSGMRSAEQSTTTAAAAEGGTQRSDTEGASGQTTNQREAKQATAGVANGDLGNRDLEAFYDARTVLDVQRKLADRGLEVGRVDGVWGPRSQSALRNFQQDRGLEASGRINAPTLAALDIAAGTGEGREGTTR